MVVAEFLCGRCQCILGLHVQHLVLHDQLAHRGFRVEHIILQLQLLGMHGLWPFDGHCWLFDRLLFHPADLQVSPPYLHGVPC